MRMYMYDNEARVLMSKMEAHTHKDGGTAADVAEEDCDVGKHEHIADEDGGNVRPALSVDLILNGTLGEGGRT